MPPAIAEQDEGGRRKCLLEKKRNHVDNSAFFGWMLFLHSQLAQHPGHTFLALLRILPMRSI